MTPTLMRRMPPGVDNTCSPLLLSSYSTSFVEVSIAGTVHGLTKEGRGTISQETRISYKGVFGKQLTLKTKLGKQKVRIFAVNGGAIANIYLVAVRDNTGKVDDAQTNAFLDSFAFQPH